MMPLVIGGNADGKWVRSPTTSASVSMPGEGWAAGVPRTAKAMSRDLRN